jgi:hypothetical protein
LLAWRCRMDMWVWMRCSGVSVSLLCYLLLLKMMQIALALPFELLVVPFPFPLSVLPVSLSFPVSLSLSFPLIPLPNLFPLPILVLRTHAHAHHSPATTLRRCRTRIHWIHSRPRTNPGPVHTRLPILLHWRNRPAQWMSATTRTEIRMVRMDLPRTSNDPHPRSCYPDLGT